MIDLIPVLVDGAIVFNLKKGCHTKPADCDQGRLLAIHLHNWVKLSQLEYLIFDFQDEKKVCPAFLEEVQAIRKRLTIPILFSGVMEKPLKELEKFNYSKSYPLFVTPEDAVRALRMQYPGLTETSPRIPVHFEHSLMEVWQTQHSEASLAIL